MQDITQYRFIYNIISYYIGKWNFLPDTELFFADNFIVDKKGSHQEENPQTLAKINGRRFMKRNNVSAIIIKVSGKGDARRLKFENQQKLMRLLCATCNLAFSLGDAQKCPAFTPLPSPPNPSLRGTTRCHPLSLLFGLLFVFPVAYIFFITFLSRYLEAFIK